LVERLQICLASPQPLEALQREFRAVDDVLDVASWVGMEEQELGRAVVRLFGAHVAELDAFLAEVEPLGRGREGGRPLVAMFPAARVRAG
jgi:hypothetical protein